MSDDTATMQRPGHEGRERARAAGALLLVWSPPPMPPRLVGLDRSIVIGRDGPPGSVIIPHASASRVHARITPKGDGYLLADLGSRNGTLVRGRRITEHMLMPGDDVRIGDAIYVFVSDVDRFVTPSRLPSLPPGFIGGATLAQALEGLPAIAKTDLPVLVTGETGTGKELVARAVHAWSGRSGRFAAVNCAAIPTTLLESELFGARKGAFTGADRDRLGLVRTANGGTLVLDEIGDMPLDAQAKLLRMIETREVVPLGGSAAEKVDVRLVAATHRDLQALVTAGTFRGDLLARLMGFSVSLPPLRARKEDLPALIDHVLAEERRDDLSPTLPFMVGMVRWDWPFNVRELRSVVRRAIALCPPGSARELSAEHLPEPMRAALTGYGDAGSAAAPPITSSAAATIAPPPAPHAVPRPRDKAPTEAAMRALLTEHAGNVAQVARVLGKDRAQIHRWMARYGLDPDAFRGNDDS